METCADCGKIITPLEASYYRKGPADDIGQTYHSACGDLFGIKAKDAEIVRLREALESAPKPQSETAWVLRYVDWFETIRSKALRH